MTKCVLAALAIALVAPVTAHAGTVVRDDGAARTSTADGFSLPALLEGVDRVLSSVDDGRPAVADPFGGEAAAFTDLNPSRPVPVRRIRAAYDSAAAATDPLPEPTTWLMMILGFFGLSFAVRRRTSVSSGDRVRFS